MKNRKLVRHTGQMEHTEGRGETEMEGVARGRHSGPRYLPRAVRPPAFSNIIADPKTVRNDRKDRKDYNHIVII